MSPRPNIRARNPMPLAGAARAEQVFHSTRSPNSSFNTGFREWLRKITSHSDDATKLACEQLKLTQVKQMVCDLLGGHVSGMSARDLRVYLRIVLASRIDSVRDVRFECFDLMCRKLSEPVAVRQLQQLDLLIA